MSQPISSSSGYTPAIDFGTQSIVQQSQQQTQLQQLQQQQLAAANRLASTTGSPSVMAMNANQTLQLAQVLQGLGGALSLLQVPGLLPATTSSSDLSQALAALMQQLTSIPDGSVIPTPSGAPSVNAMVASVANGLISLPPATLGALLYATATNGGQVPVTQDQFSQLLQQWAGQPTGPGGSGILASLAQACFTTKPGTTTQTLIPAVTSLIDPAHPGQLLGAAAAQITKDWSAWSSGTLPSPSGNNAISNVGWGPASSTVLLQQLTPYIEALLGNSLQTLVPTAATSVGEGLSMILVGISTLPLGGADPTSSINLEGLYQGILGSSIGVFRMGTYLPQLAHGQLHSLLKGAFSNPIMVDEAQGAVQQLAGRQGATSAQLYLSNVVQPPITPVPDDKFDAILGPLYYQLSGPQANPVITTTLSQEQQQQLAQSAQSVGNLPRSLDQSLLESRKG